MNFGMCNVGCRLGLARWLEFDTDALSTIAFPRADQSGVIVSLCMLLVSTQTRGIPIYISMQHNKPESFSALSPVPWR